MAPSALVPQLSLNATAIVNLGAVVSLERAAGRAGRLIAVSGAVNREGRLAGGDPWYYTFREPGDVPGAVHQWRVDSMGGVTYEHLGICGLDFSEDLSGGDLGLDSDRVIALALEQGVGAFLKDHPGSDNFGIVYGNQQAQVTLSAGPCYRPWVVLNRRSGVLTSENLVCAFGPVMRTCSGPGVF